MARPSISLDGLGGGGGEMRLDPAVEILLLDMARNRCYGEVVIKYEAGKIVLLKKCETLKPSAGREPSNGTNDKQ